MAYDEYAVAFFISGVKWGTFRTEAAQS